MERPWLAHYDPGIPERIAYPQLSLGALLDESVRRFAERPALKLILRYVGPVCISSELTYRQLGEQVDRFAAALHELGVRKGDRVAIMLPNLPQYVVAFFGLLKLGAITVNTNPTYTARELEHQLADSGAETIILISPLYDRLKQVQSRTAVKRVIVTDIGDTVSGPASALVNRQLARDGHLVAVPEGAGVYRFRTLLAGALARPPRVEVSPDEVALLQYTGGTTGVPKGAMLSHYNLSSNCLQMRAWLTGVEDGKERLVGALPFFHIYGVTVEMVQAVQMGAQLLILPSPRPITNVLEAVSRERATLFPGVPTMYIALLNHPKLKAFDLGSVKVCISGAAPLPVEVQEAFERASGGRLLEGYGLTEAGPVTHANPILGRRKPGSIGVPLPDVEAQIVDVETLLERPTGETGELWVRGPQIMAGYWQQPQETALALTADCWLRTGDLARRDEDGFFFLVDRLKDIIITSGFNVIPREVEEILYSHPQILEAVVAGVPDAYRGEMVKAYVVLKPGEHGDAGEIIAFCAERLARFKVPRQVEFRAELPKSLVGKFLRRVLVEEERARESA